VQINIKEVEKVKVMKETLDLKAVDTGYSIEIYRKREDGTERRVSVYDFEHDKEHMHKRDFVEMWFRGA
jgi:hypothetical protein